MALPYHRISKEQDAMRNLLDKGEYPFHVETIEQKPTKKRDNTMLEIELQVMGTDGRQFKIKDWIVITMEDMAWKLRHFADSCGLIEKYDTDLLEPHDFLGKNGVVKLCVRDYEKDGESRKINSVVDYIKKSAQSMANNASVSNSSDFDLNDSIPF